MTEWQTEMTHLAGCARCVRMADKAITMATVTGSVGSTASEANCSAKVTRVVRRAEKPGHVVIHWDGLNWQGSLVKRGQVVDLAYVGGETEEDHRQAAADAWHRWGVEVQYRSGRIAADRGGVR